MIGAADVSTPTKAQSAMAHLAAPIRTLVAGTAAMRLAGEAYLPKEPSETQAAYDNRRKRSYLFNATGKTVSDMTGKVFVKQVTLAADMPEQLVAWSENIDLAGRHINVFARDVFEDAMQPGIGFIYVDMPPPVQRPDGQPATLADEQTAGIRPYLKYIPLENMVGWKSTTIAGAETLTQIRISECVTEPDGEWGEKEIEQIRVVDVNGLGTGCIWRTFRKAEDGDNKGKWLQFGTGNISIKSIPLVPVYLSRSGFMQGKPPLAKLAELNIAHWQSASDQRNILHVARVPILFGAGWSESDKLVIGASEMAFNSNPAAKLEYVEHSGAAIGAGDKDLQNLEMQMQAMGLQLLIDKPGQTATGEVRDDVKENSPLAMMATALQDALEQAFAFMAQFAGVDMPVKDVAGKGGGSVVVNKDFGINGSTSDLQYLTQAAIGGKISRETYWAEMQRRGVLSDAFDPEVEAQRVQDEAPDVTAPPGKGMNLDNNPNDQ